MINRKRLIKLTQNLIRLNSENPPGNERATAIFVKNYLNNIGLKTRTYEFERNRTNLVAYLPGIGKEYLLVTPHLDTVPSGKSWKKNPFSAKIVNGRLYGLGATDCKCNIAVAIEAVNSIIEEKIVLPYNLIIAATADEESGSGLGLIPLLRKRILKPDAALVLDADDFEIITSQKGLMHIKIKITGKKAHGAYPFNGVNAIDIAVAVIRDIKKLNFPYHRHRYLKAPTLNLGTIKGGDKVNIVPDRCEFELDFRFLPGMDVGVILKKVRNILNRQSRIFSRFSATHVKPGKVEIESIQKPYEISEEDSLVRFLKEAFLCFGVAPEVKGSEGATVITFFQDRGIPAVATGFGVSGCAHAADEYVRLANIYKGALALEKFLKIYHFNN